MPITAATTLSGFSGFIPRNQAQPIFERAARTSIVQRLANEIPLGYAGESIPVVTSRVQAGWVAEAGRKPASQAAMTLKTMDPKKLAVIAVVSAEVVRANPGNYMQVLRGQVAEAFALGFDLAALFDQGPDGTAGAGPFDNNLAQATTSVELTTVAATYDELVAGATTLTNLGKSLTGFALDGRMEWRMRSAKDSAGMPLWADLRTDTEADLLQAASSGVGLRTGMLLGRPAGITESNRIYEAANDVMALGGDWSQVAWGVVGGINYSISTETAVTINGALVSLWENNLVAIRAEAEYGFVVNDTASFVKYIDAV